MVLGECEKKTCRFICKKTEIQLAHQIDGYLAISRGNFISPEMEMQSSAKLLLFLLHLFLLQINRWA